MAEQEFEKDTCCNFVAEDEITVTITFNEYRNLVNEVAMKNHDLEKEREKTREANKKAEVYKTKLDALIEKLNGVEDEKDADV